MALANRAMRGRAPIIILLGIISGGLFYGDAIITPSLSVLSAIEGIKTITPTFQPYVVPITAAILLGLFSVQSYGTARVASFFGPITLVWFIALALAGIWHISQAPAVLFAFNPLLWRDVPDPPRDHRSLDPRRRVPGGDRLGSALRRPRPFRPRADPHGLALRRAAGADHQLPRSGRPRVGRSEGNRESVLSSLPAMGLDPDGAARHGGHGDRQPGGDHRRLFRDAAGDPARAPAAARNPPHVGSLGRPDFHAAREWLAAGRRAAPRLPLPLVGRARVGLWHRRHRHDGGHDDACLHRDLEGVELVADRRRPPDRTVSGAGYDLPRRQSPEGRRRWLDAASARLGHGGGDVYVAARNGGAGGQDDQAANTADRTDRDAGAIAARIASPAPPCF